MKNHLTGANLYIRAENSSTGCTNILRGFCKMLWYCSILFILNQQKSNNIFYCCKFNLQSFKLLLLTGISGLRFTNFLKWRYGSYVICRRSYVSVLFTGDTGTMGQQLNMLKDSILEMLNKCGQITRNILTAGQTAQSSNDDIMKAEEAISRSVWLLSHYGSQIQSNLW